MKNSNEIQSEITRTTQKIDELETQLSDRTTTFEAAQAAFVSGKTNIDELHSEQSKLTLLSQGIAALKASYLKLKSAFEARSVQERRADLLKQMATSANEVEPLVADYLLARSEFHELVSDFAEKLVEKGEAYRKKQDLYRSIVRELQPTDAEIRESGIGQKTMTLAMTGHINHPSTGTFDEAVSLAEKLLAAKLNKAARSERIAAFHARTIAEQSATN